MSILEVMSTIAFPKLILMPKFQANQPQSVSETRLRALALYLRGNAYLDAGNFNNARMDLSKSLDLHGEFAPAHLAHGVACYQQRWYQPAIMHFREAIARDPALKANCAKEFALALAFEGKRLYDTKKDYGESVSHLLEALALDPELPGEHRNRLSDALVYRGIAFYNATQLAEAFADYSSAIELRSDAYWAIRNRAMISRRWKRFDEALKDCDEAIRVNPTYAVAYYERAWVYIDQRDYQTGVTEMTEAIRFKQDAEYYHDRGFCYRRMFRFKEAIADFDEALKLDPKRAWSFYNRGYSYRKMGDYKQALADFEQAVQLNPKEGEFVLERGRTLLNLHKIKRGIADLESASLLGTESSYVQNLLAWIWATWPHKRVLNAPRALEAARKACEMTSYKDADYVDTLAAAHAQVGEFAEAVKWQTLATEVAPASSKKSFSDRLESYQVGKPWRDNGQVEARL
jgi:tetratricopeptide (TPR) repeat protein